MYAREEPFLFYQTYFVYLTEGSEILGNSIRGFQQFFCTTDLQNTKERITQLTGLLLILLR